jgi:hypothetical protein
MGLFDLLEKISGAVEAALIKVTPKGFKLAYNFKSAVTSKIASFASGVRSQYSSWEIPFPAKIRAKKFMDQLKIELRKRGVAVNSGRNFLEFEKAKVSLKRNKISIEKLTTKVKGAPKVAFIRLKMYEAKRMLKESYQILYKSASRSSIAAFQNKYAKHLIAASDGIKAGLSSLGQKPESRIWDKRIEKFLNGYSDYLLRKHKKESILPSSEFSLNLGSSKEAKKFKSAFQEEVKRAIGKTKPAHLAINIKGTQKPKLVVKTEAKKISQVKFAVNKPKRKAIR